MPKTEPWATFGAWIKETREKQKLSQAGAAERAELDRQQWYRIENGVSGTRRETVIRMARALSADPDEALQLAGFASLPKGKPQTMAELLNRLAELGISHVEFLDDEAIRNATPEDLADVLRAVEITLEVTLRNRNARPPANRSIHPASP